MTGLFDFGLLLACLLARTRNDDSADSLDSAGLGDFVRFGDSIDLLDSLDSAGLLVLFDSIISMDSRNSRDFSVSIDLFASFSNCALMALISRVEL